MTPTTGASDIPLTEEESPKPSTPLMFRQGDVLLVRVETLPDTRRPLADCVVAHGEATGHRHRVEHGARQYRDPAGIQFLEVLEAEVELVHEEHGPIRLPGPAIYRVVHQREYDPTVHGWSREVLD